MFKLTELNKILLFMTVAISPIADAANKAIPSNFERNKNQSSNNFEVLINCILSKPIASQRVNKKPLHGYSEKKRKTVFHF